MKFICANRENRLRLTLCTYTFPGLEEIISPVQMTFASFLYGLYLWLWKEGGSGKTSIKVDDDQDDIAFFLSGK